MLDKDKLANLLHSSDGLSAPSFIDMIDASFRALVVNVFAVHCHRNATSRCRHRTLGLGDVAWQSAAILQPRDVRVRLVVEVGGYPLDYTHVKCLWEQVFLWTHTAARTQRKFPGVFAHGWSNTLHVFCISRLEPRDEVTPQTSDV